MQKPNVLLLGGNDALEADLKTALRDVCTIMPLNVPAELIADEYRRLNPGAAIVVVSAQTPQRFGLIYNIVAAGGVVIVVSPTKDPELILRAMRAVAGDVRGVVALGHARLERRELLVHLLDVREGLEQRVEQRAGARE